MRLCVGILGNKNYALQSLLHQIGVPFEQTGFEFSADRYSAVIADDSESVQNAEAVKKYLKEGGALLCSGTFFGILTGRRSSKRFIRWIAGDDADQMFQGIGFVDLCAECSVPDGASCLHTNEKKSSALVETVGQGHVIALPFDLGAMVSDRRVMTKSFFAERSRLPFETVSLVSRSGVRGIVTRALELLHHRRGLPFIHSWYYPRMNRNIFSFRIDTDYAEPDDLASLYGVLRKHKIRATWFVDVKHQENNLSFFRTLQDEGQEIGVHCYEHATFDDYERNDQNIKQAITRLTESGVQPKGFAAPFGKWNINLSRAIAENGFEYSSEFSYDYDNLPGIPASGDDHMPALQVPVHPISIGSLRRQSFSPDEMKQYFENVVHSKLRRSEPLFFYHHPKNFHHDVLEHLFHMIRAEEIPAMTMREFTQWWKSRTAVHITASVEGNRAQVECSNAGEDTLLRISRQGDEEAILSSSRIGDVENIEWKKKQLPVSLPSDVHRIRKFNPWIQVNRIEDFIHSMMDRK